MKLLLTIALALTTAASAQSPKNTSLVGTWDLDPQHSTVPWKSATITYTKETPDEIAWTLSAIDNQDHSFESHLEAKTGVETPVEGMPGMTETWHKDRTFRISGPQFSMDGKNTLSEDGNTMTTTTTMKDPSGGEHELRDTYLRRTGTTPPAK